MKHCLPVVVAFLVMINVALGAVGDSGVYDGISAPESDQGYLTVTDQQGTDQQGAGGYQAAPVGASVPYLDSSYQSSYLQPQSNQPSQVQPISQSSSAAAYSIPQIRGPYQERMSAEELKLSQPQAESFHPDGSLDFVSTTLPNGLTTGTYGSTQGAIKGSGSWYYPGSVISPNRFYVQTSSGLSAVGGCGLGGYLPLWADINSGGNFFVYEWYPGQYTPSVRWWGWTWPGFKKGWFSGDAPGWHILCYSCRDWSNYIYIYVYPGVGAAPNAFSSYPNDLRTVSQGSLPTGAPTPPDPNTESLVLPDFNLYKPVTGQASQSGYSGYPSQSGYPVQGNYPAQANYPVQGNNPAQAGYPVQGSNPAQANYPVQGNYPAQAGYPVQGNYPAQAGYSTKSCTTCASPTAVAGGVSGSCPTCSASSSLAAPYGYAPQSYQAVYPTPSICRCNEYYVQPYPGRLSTVAGVYCGEWLPLWSKVSRPGVYWSFEWTVCKNRGYCSPEVRNFGSKNTGWYQTWFRGNNPGWHILSYYCNDWSNYIYVYVWPAS
jgi:hypothetical protein